MRCRHRKRMTDDVGGGICGGGKGKIFHMGTRPPRIFSGDGTKMRRSAFFLIEGGRRKAKKKEEP